MRLLIKIFILLIVFILIVLSIWGEYLLEGIGSKILGTPIDINRLKFLPHKLIFKLYGINMPEKYILFLAGTISLFPQRLEFYGFKFMDKILLGQKDFSLCVSRHNGWEINGFFKGVDLTKLDYGFKKGEINGSVDGIYNSGNCEFYGILYLNNIIYSDSGGNFLGISADELRELIEKYNGRLELDFTYKGPINKVDELYRYKPGRKTIGLIKTYLLKKVVPFSIK